MKRTLQILLGLAVFALVVPSALACDRMGTTASVEDEVIEAETEVQAEEPVNATVNLELQGEEAAGCSCGATGETAHEGCSHATGGEGELTDTVNADNEGGYVCPHAAAAAAEGGDS